MFNEKKIRRLMPLNKTTFIDTMTVDQNFQIASKTFTSSLDKRKGYKFAKKERISTWDLIEGVKNASALCQSWFGLSKIERRMTRYDYQQKLLIRHKHLNMHKELTYFKEKPEVPSDLVEVGLQVVLPTPTTPSATTSKKEKQAANTAGNDIINLGINGMPNSSANQSSPSTHNLNQSNSAEIVIIGKSKNKFKEYSNLKVLNRQFSNKKGYKIFRNLGEKKLI